MVGFREFFSVRQREAFEVMRRSHNSTHHQRYSAKKMTKPVVFMCLQREAQRVSVMGDFNDWNPETHPMQRQLDGAWRIEVPLTHGHHRYLFSVDGVLELDPRAQGMEKVEEGHVSLVAVS